MTAFDQSAPWYDALCRDRDYAGAAADLRRRLERIAPNAASLLDVGCGTGRHLEHLRTAFEVQGLDASVGMLEVARTRCPGVVFHAADFTDFALGRRFDVITCLFGTIAYARSEDGLRRAVHTMAGHLTDAGVLVIEPWLSPARYRAGAVTGDFVNDPELKVARMYVTRAEQSLATYDIHYLVADREGVRSFSEQQQLGLFTHEQQVGALDSAGLDVDFDARGLFGYGLYVGRRR